jgi:hypothetical protein
MHSVVVPFSAPGGASIQQAENATLFVLICSCTSVTTLLKDRICNLTGGLCVRSCSSRTLQGGFAPVDISLSFCYILLLCQGWNEHCNLTGGCVESSSTPAEKHAETPYPCMQGCSYMQGCACTQDWLDPLRSAAGFGVEHVLHA